jgi:hypothetical protein
VAANTDVFRFESPGVGRALKIDRKPGTNIDKPMNELSVEEMTSLRGGGGGGHEGSKNTIIAPTYNANFSPQLNLAGFALHQSNSVEQEGSSNSIN